LGKVALKYGFIMPPSSSKLALRKSANKLTLEDLDFILGVAVESLKTAQNSLSLLKDVIPPNVPVSSWIKKTDFNESCLK
jgi:hypothetical protein